MVMNLAYKIFKSIIVSTCILFLVAVTSYAQEVPIPQKHLVYQFIERQITLGNLSQSDVSVRPLTYTKVREMFKQLMAVSDKLSAKDRQLLRRFESEFSIEIFESTVSFPLQKSTLKSIGNTAFNKYQIDRPEPHLLSYRDSAVYAWADVSETMRLEAIEESIYRRFTDRVSVFGSLYDQL